MISVPGEATAGFPGVMRYAAYESRVHERVICMTGNFDFSGKTVLDIGCNTGAVSRAVAEHAEMVYGLDTDGAAIDMARQLVCHPNVTYAKDRNSEFWPKFLRADGYDVVLCLSVMHHIMADSGYYRQSITGAYHALQLMEKVYANCRWLWFEMGSSQEFAPWAKRMPDMGDYPDDWIEQFLYAAGFRDIKVFPTPMLQTHPFQAWLHRNFYQLIGNHPFLYKLTGFDDRDSRSLFLCRGGLKS